MQQPAASAPADNEAAVLFEGIARRRQVSAVYNGMEMHVAPHVLYTRAGMLYLAGVVTRRRGQPVDVAKVGIFKVEGLSAMTLRDEGFDPDPGFDPADERFAATAIFTVEP